MTRRAPRVALTSGGARGWARVAAPDDYIDAPNGDLTMAGTKPVLPPAELANRCRAMGARVDGPDNGPWKVYPPDGTSRPLTVPKRLRPGNEYFNIVAQLRRAGLDIYADDGPGEPTSNGHAPTPGDMPPKLEGLPGGRPTLSYTLADAITDAATEETRPADDAPSGEQADYLIMLLEEINGTLPALRETVDQLDKRVEKLESSDRSMGRLDTAVGALARRVGAAENAAEAATAGLETANRITRELDGRIDTVHARLDRADAAAVDEPQPEPEPTEPARESVAARRARLTEAVHALLAATPPVIKVRRGNILDALGIDVPSEREDIRNYVLPALVDDGRVLRHGTGAGTGYTINPEETPDA